MNYTIIIVGLVLLFAFILIGLHLYDIYKKHRKIQEKKEAELRKKNNIDDRMTILRTTLQKQINSRFEEPSFFNFHTLVRILEATVIVAVLVAITTTFLGSLDVINQTINSTEAKQVASITKGLTNFQLTIVPIFVALIVIALAVFVIIILSKSLRSFTPL